MPKESHGYRYVSRVSEPQELYEILRPHMVKDVNSNDPGKNCVFKIEGMTIVLSLTKGKITLHCNLKKTETEKKLKEIISKKDLVDGLVDNLKLNKKEIRDHRSLDTKKGYCDYHYFPSNDTPSSLGDLQIKLNEKDFRILGYVCKENSINTTMHKRFYMSYWEFKRRLDKLAKFMFLKKIGKSPASYVLFTDERGFKIQQFVNLWWELIHPTPESTGANLREIQTDRNSTGEDR